MDRLRLEGTVLRAIYGAHSSLPLLIYLVIQFFPISDAVHCNRSRSALHPPLQCTASVLAVHCLFSCKYVQPSPQVRATVPANTCNRPCKYVRLR